MFTNDGGLRPDGSALMCINCCTMADDVGMAPLYNEYGRCGFDGTSYITVYLIFMYGALPLAILFAAAAWQFTQRFNLSMVLFILFGGLSLTVWAQNWQLCWLNPCVWAVSDDFSNRRLFWGVAYMRLTWLIALAGLWGISYLCIRRYGKGAVGSLCCNIRRPIVRCWPCCCCAAPVCSM